MTSVKKDNHKPWVTSCILNSIKQKNKLYLQYIKNPCVTTKNRYKLYRNKLTHLLRIAERSYVRDFLKRYNGELKKSWQLINNIISKNTNHNQMPKSIEAETGSTITEPKEIADLFNKYFVNIGPTLAKTINPTGKDPLSYMSERSQMSMFLKPVNNNELLDAFKTLKDTSSGYDEIKPVVLREVRNELLYPVVILINASFKKGIFPDCLKTACVSPIYKQGKKNVVSNYRPISVLCAMSKVFERIMCNRLVDFMNKFNLLFKDQYGFRKGYSTDLAIIRITNYILKALDDRNHVIGVYMDLAKAFDTLNHNVLIAKLDHLGIRGPALNWFKSYLSERDQMVKYDGVFSEKCKISYGVPQGSILGPILFLLYINDLYCISKDVALIMYADDTNVFVKGTNLIDTCNIMNQELRKLAEWFRTNQLSLNISKTNFMIFSNNNIGTQCDIKINDLQLERVTSTKFLGVVIDEKLSWKDHISFVNSKISKCIGILYKVRNIFGTRWRIKLYNSFILPYINYCNIVWCSTYHSYLKDIIVTQKRALKLALGVPKLTSSDTVFTNSKALQLSEINNVQVGIFMYKYYSQMLPVAYDFNCVVNNEIHEHNTRFSVNYHVPKPRTNKFKFSMLFKGPYLWNGLPASVKKSSSLTDAKKLLKLYFSNVS